jgi:hypothetical protein
VAAGVACDWLARRTGRRFPISAVRIRKYAASTQFSADRVATTGFTPRHSLHDALVATIRHEFVTDRGSSPHPSVAAT